MSGLFWAHLGCIGLLSAQRRPSSWA